MYPTTILLTCDIENYEVLFFSDLIGKVFREEYSVAFKKAAEACQLDEQCITKL